MAKAAPVKPVRRTPTRSKTSTTRKTVNRFAALAGGDSPDQHSPTPADTNNHPAEGLGLLGAMSELGDHPMHVVQIRVADTAPHPFNDPERSEPQPTDSKWTELVNSVATNGVRLPVLAVPRNAFLAARPTAAAQIPDTAQYVLIYGHRRRAASLHAGRQTIPAVIDHTIMEDNGDLDAMAAENLGRQDLSEIAEADLFARYSDLGLTQTAIAERLGVDQATVSRRLALLLMTPAVREAISTGAIRAADAATLAAALPYGPRRRWQRSKDTAQETDQRREEQETALTLTIDRNMTAARAAEWVIAARAARAQAEQWGIELVEDPRTELGDRFYEYRVDEYAAQPGLIGALDPALGSLVLYAPPTADSAAAAPAREPGDDTAADSPTGSPTPPHAGGGVTDPAEDIDLDDDEAPNDPYAASIDESRRAEQASAAAAQAHRRRSCAALIAHQISNADLLKILVAQYLSGVAARSGTSAVTALLNDWDADAPGPTDRARASRAWHRAVAAAELHTTELKDTAWDEDACAHVRMLVDRVGYQPTTWEQAQLDRQAR